LSKGEKTMVKKFEDGKLYVRKGSKEPYEVIIEAAVYRSKNDAGQIEETLMLDWYFFDDRFVPETNGRIYASGGCLESPVNYNPKDFKELGKTAELFEIGNACLFEKKPTYTQLEKALKQIEAAKPAEFRNWHRMTEKLQEIAREALKVNQ